MITADTASQNIANVGTEGYTRRRVEAATAGTPTTPAMWSRSQNAGGGVRVSGVTRMTDAFLDARVRTEHGKQSYADVRQTVEGVRELSLELAWCVERVCVDNREAGAKRRY